MERQTGDAELRHWLLLTAYTGCPKDPLKVEFWKVVQEISSIYHFSQNFILNKIPTACIPVKSIFSEICDLWYWHELLMGQMLVASDQTFSETTAYWIYHSDKTSASPQYELSNESNFQIFIKSTYTQVIKDGIPMWPYCREPRLTSTHHELFICPLILDIVSICAYSIELMNTVGLN